MNHAFIINPVMDVDGLKEAIYQKITQARSISEGLLVSDKEMEPTVRYGIVWTIDSLLEEIDTLVNCLVQAQAQPKAEPTRRQNLLSGLECEYPLL